jgi:tRNA pseudouridine38-40 synthase
VGASRLSHRAAGQPQTGDWYSLWAKVEYDGTDFLGFQLQTHGRTVQGEIERALGVVTGSEVRVIGAGRTDRGVHAQGQVVSFEVAWRHGLSDLQRALNAVLAADVTIWEMGAASEGFHPRFGALSRTYQYTILNGPWRSPLRRRTAWHIAQDLDTAKMAQASRCLVGTHDFSTFGRPPQGENSVRTVLRAEWCEQASLLLFEIEANAFLYRMVRSIVGALALVGCGQMSPEEFELALAAHDRSQIKRVAPAHGLSLIRVKYGRREGVMQ